MRKLCPETDSQRRWSEVRLGEVLSQPLAKQLFNSAQEKGL
jgi:hypothetical protein